MQSIRAIFVAAAALLVATPTLAAAGFVNNAGAWARLSPDTQAAYVQGLNDTANYIFVNDDLPTAIVKVARTRCLVEQRTTAAMLANAIGTIYSRDPKLKEQPPSVLYIQMMAAACRNIINQERARMSLPPL